MKSTAATKAAKAALVDNLNKKYKQSRGSRMACGIFFAILSHVNENYYIKSSHIVHQLAGHAIYNYGEGGEQYEKLRTCVQ